MPTFDALPRSRLPASIALPLYAVSPRRFALRNAARHGRSYVMKAIAGRVLFTADPEHVRRIFASDSETFATLSAVSLQGLFGPKSVLITSGKVHKRQRKLLSPPLTGARLRAFGQSMQGIADEHIAKLKPGQTFRALDLSTEFTLAVIVRTVFGVSSTDEEEELRGLLHALVDDIPPSALFMPQLQQRWYPPWARYMAHSRRFDAWLSRKITQRRAQPTSGIDVLSILLDTRYDDGSPMDDAEIRDQLVTLLLAGHETTAIAIASCLRQLHQHPAVLARLMAELDQAPMNAEEVQRLPYLSAVIDETLRLDPIVTDIARITKAPYALDDELTVARGRAIIVLIEALHHDESLYPNAAVFRPERFLERKFAPSEYIPFGGGVRRCLGAAFSDYEMKIFLASLLRAVVLERADSKPEKRVRRNITMGPKRGVPLRVVARSAARGR